MFSSYFAELAFKTLTIFDNLFKVTNDKNFIIDPLTCMIRLSMLSFKDIGTKIKNIELRKAGDIGAYKYRWLASFEIK